MTKERRKKRGRTLPGSMDAWAQSVARRTGTEIRADAIPEGKMSDIVADYAGPLLYEFVEYEDDSIPILELACILWNLSVLRSLGGDAQRGNEQDLMQLLYGDPFFPTPAEALNLIGDMVSRWKQDYSWYRRLIVDKKIELRQRGPYMIIVSASIGDGKRPSTAD